MLRRTLLSLTILGALAAPAMADGLKTGGYQLYGKSYQGYSQGYQGYGSPGITNNTATNSNVAAGQGNIASQKVIQSQSGGGHGYSYVPPITNNTAVNTNVAAGQGNIAAQEIFQLQSGR